MLGMAVVLVIACRSVVWPGLGGLVQERVQPVDLDNISCGWLILGAGLIRLSSDPLAQGYQSTAQAPGDRAVS